MEDGRLIWLNGQSFSPAHERRVANRPTAWCREGNYLLVGNEGGGIDCFDYKTSKVIFSYDSESQNRVDDLVANGRKVYAVLGGERVIALDTARLEIMGEFVVDSALLHLSQTDNAASVAVGSSDSMMYLLRASDLSLIRKYRADGEIIYPGLNMDGYAYFYSTDGIMYGLRY
jgi:hypothetical protein